MQREIQYRYCVKNKHTGNIEFKVYSLIQIENEGLRNLFNVGDYEIISRDRFTGLTDKNGVKIFEGDIVKTEMGNVCEIRWCEVTEFVWNEDDYITDSFSYTGFAFFNLKLNKAFHMDVTNTIEVIGSIHTTPELIKEDNE